jgi:hypothetical protein
MIWKGKTHIFLESYVKYYGIISQEGISSRVPFEIAQEMPDLRDNEDINNLILFIQKEESIKKD